MRRTDSWKRPWIWERLKAGGEGDDRGWDSWMALLTRWTWVWASSGELVMDWEAWRAAVHGVAKSQRWLSNWADWLTELFTLNLIEFGNPLKLYTELMCQCIFQLLSYSKGWFLWSQNTYVLKSPYFVSCALYVLIILNYNNKDAVSFSADKRASEPCLGVS